MSARGRPGQMGPTDRRSVIRGRSRPRFASRAVQFAEAIDTVIIGWVNTRQAARAIAEALPLLRLATSTRIVCVVEPTAPPRRIMGLADGAADLDRHGVRVSFNGPFSAQRDAATIILEEAHRFSADFIVAGGYGLPVCANEFCGVTVTSSTGRTSTTNRLLVISSLIYRSCPLIEDEAEVGRPGRARAAVIIPAT